MNEQRLERALREGPQFATHYVPRPLPLTDELGQRIPSGPRRAALLLAVVALLLAAFGAMAIVGGSLHRMPPSPSPMPTRSAAAQPLVGFAACEPTGSGNGRFGDPSTFCPGRLPAGTHTTQAFLAGMTITVPDGRWISTLDSPWDFVLRLVDHPGATMWFDLDPSASDGDRIIPGASDTPASLLSRLKSNPNLIISGETNRTLDDGIEALSFDLDLSESAPPVGPTCALTSKANTFNGKGGRPPSCYSYLIMTGLPFGSAKGEPVRMYLAQIGDEGTRHILLVILDNADAADAAGWTQLTAAADGILASLRLPDTLPPSY
jgi:hypothetical protein